MATINFTQGKFESPPLSSGDVNNGGSVGFYSPDGAYSTPKTTYTTKELTTPNAHPLVLDSMGRGTVYFDGDADCRILDSTGGTVYDQRNVNPPSIISVTDVTVATTLSAAINNQYITTTADITIPTAAAAGSGWIATIKNLSTTSVSIIRSTSGDTINSLAAELTLPGRQSVVIAVNAGITGFDIYYNPLMEIASGSSGQVLSLADGVPAWTTADLKAMGSKLYMFNNFT